MRLIHLAGVAAAIVTVGLVLSAGFRSYDTIPAPRSEDVEYLRTIISETEVMRPERAAEFGVFCIRLVAAGNATAPAGYRMSLEKDHYAVMRNRRGQVTFFMDLYPFERSGHPPEETGPLLIKLGLKTEFNKRLASAASEIFREEPPTPVPTETPVPPTMTPTPIPEPTVDPRIAQVNRLMGKAAEKWQAGDKKVALILAEEALKEAETTLPAGHPKIAEVRAKVDATRAAVGEN